MIRRPKPRRSGANAKVPAREEKTLTNTKLKEKTNMMMQIALGAGIEINENIRFKDLCDSDGKLSTDPNARVEELIRTLETKLAGTVENLSEHYSVVSVVVGPESPENDELATAKNVMQERVDQITSNNDELATDFADAVQDTSWELVNKMVRAWGTEHQAGIVDGTTP